MYHQINEKTENDENSNPNDFKILQRETSVYKYYVELKDATFTEQGYLDLAKVPGLYVEGTGQFLRDLRENHCLTQKELATILRIREWSLSKWEANRKRVPLQSLVKITELFEFPRDKIYSLIDQGKFKIRTPLPIKFEKIRDIIQFLKPPRRRHKSVTVLKCSPMIKNLIESFGFKIKQSERGFRINSIKLYDYLTTFFRYSKIPKINPPLTTDVKFWFDQGVDLKRAIIISCLQSDGSSGNSRYHQTRLFFVGHCKSLHNYLVDSMHYVYKLLPSCYFTHKNYVPVTIYQQQKNEIKEEIMKLAGNTKTSPANGQSIKEYLKEPQPHLNYLINSSKTEKKIAFRIWASTEGAISIAGSKNGISISFRIGCAHPRLVKELQQVARLLKINLKTEKAEENWSGIQGLAAYTMKNLMEFIRIGGFFKGVKISSNSPYHENIPKDILTLGILEYFRQRHMNKWPQKLPMSVHHDNINKIIRNKEFKSANYYLDYFSREDDMILHKKNTNRLLPSRFLL